MAGNITERTIEQAYLFGQVGNALFEQDGKCFIVSIEDNEPVLCQGREIGPLYDAISEYSTVRNVTVKDLLEKLESLYYAYEALSFSLHGLDPSLEEEVRSSAIEMANELCQDEPQVYTFVRNRLLGYPFPLRDETEANKAIEAASSEAVKVKADRVREIYEELKKNWKGLQTFHDVWQQTVISKFSTEAAEEKTERARALRFFVDKGIVRELVTISNPDDLTQKAKSLQAKVNEKPTELEDIFDELSREFLGKLLTELAEKIKLVIVPNENYKELKGNL